MAVRAKKETKTRKRSASVNNEKDKSLESWIWDAACSIRGAKDAPKYKEEGWKSFVISILREMGRLSERIS